MRVLSLLKNGIPFIKLLIIFFTIIIGHDSIVLGAFGCGAYGNPPNHIAQLFKEVITGDFKGCFSHILFAIYDDVNAHRAHNPRGKQVRPCQLDEDELVYFLKGTSSHLRKYSIPPRQN